MFLVDDAGIPSSHGTNQLPQSLIKTCLCTMRRLCPSFLTSFPTISPPVIFSPMANLIIDTPPCLPATLERSKATDQELRSPALTCTKMTMSTPTLWTSAGPCLTFLTGRTNASVRLAAPRLLAGIQMAILQEHTRPASLLVLVKELWPDWPKPSFARWCRQSKLLVLQTRPLAPASQKTPSWTAVPPLHVLARLLRRGSALTPSTRPRDLKAPVLAGTSPPSSIHWKPAGFNEQPQPQFD